MSQDLRSTTRNAKGAQPPASEPPVSELIDSELLPSQLLVSQLASELSELSELSASGLTASEQPASEVPGAESPGAELPASELPELPPSELFQSQIFRSELLPSRLGPTEISPPEISPTEMSESEEPASEMPRAELPESEMPPSELFQTMLLPSKLRPSELPTELSASDDDGPALETPAPELLAPEAAPDELPEAPAPKLPVPQADATACPRCQKPLIDPAGLGWCKSCGYCRSLETEQHNKLMQTEAALSQGAVWAGAAGQVPWWFWVLIGGLGVLALGSLGAGLLLPEGNTFARALFTSVQMGLGVVLIFASQLFALMRVAQYDEKLSFKDAIVPSRLWTVAGKRLGELYGCLWTSVWGLGLIVFAILFIGGLQHWMTYLPGADKKNQPRQPAPRVWN